MCELYFLSFFSYTLEETLDLCHLYCPILVGHLLVLLLGMIRIPLVDVVIYIYESQLASTVSVLEAWIYEQAGALGQISLMQLIPKP